MTHDIDADTPLVPEVIADMVTTSRRKADLLCLKARVTWRASAAFRDSFAGKDERDVLRDWFQRWMAEESKPFSYDVNLDDPVDWENFLEDFEPSRGRCLATRLGFKGKNATKAADGLMNYAQNKRAAYSSREAGDIPKALEYEGICDKIYREDIQPLIKCW